MDPKGPQAGSDGTVCQRSSCSKQLAGEKGDEWAQEHPASESDLVPDDDSQELEKVIRFIKIPY